MFWLEVLGEHLVEAPEIPRVFQPHAGTHHVFEAITGLFKDSDQVLHGLVSLLDDTTDNDLAIQRRHLAGHVQPAIGFDSAGEWTRLTAAGGAAGAVTSNAHGCFS
ncbi:hypothetical protein D3C75_1156770 [compost metagenome]